ncbi:putative vacuolar ATP synthase subunit E [Mitosporidium daphniae]|uniref:Putative vacuolar ATP synthase subunit E n=1 Tax=Mitosporidium daphniae TaxID=1485682 RepID=A0A098VSG9_9MICR|nr:putative vacuolar ATP synthase subunit E [Mitosporidium daphniae]KGG51890.1 putative vacuolar ATP synthase subunit E [Mitosporidium daphniae]|eukprot:XP_013238317.1 putative vacuolar ATP synthase subunit E [Mitosporidium daphniae]
MPPLTDDQVQVEMRKMVEFIRQEAYEKYREIQVKADEDFFIEKAKAVKAEATNIEKTTEKRLAHSQVQFKVGEAMHKNKARLKVLQERDNQLNLVIEATKEKLPKIISSPSYRTLLQKLILQVLFTLCDGNITVYCCERDKPLVDAISSAAIVEFKEKTSTECKLTIQVGAVSQFPALASGGIIATCKGGRVMINNTLQKRLELLAEQSLPALKEAFIGPCPSRRFFD